MNQINSNFPVLKQLLNYLGDTPWCQELGHNYITFFYLMYISSICSFEKEVEVYMQNNLKVRQISHLLEILDFWTHLKIFPRIFQEIKQGLRWKVAFGKITGLCQNDSKVNLWYRNISLFFISFCCKKASFNFFQCLCCTPWRSAFPTRFASYTYHSLHHLF